jgi:acid phosphatase
MLSIVPSGSRLRAIAVLATVLPVLLSSCFNSDSTDPSRNSPTAPGGAAGTARLDHVIVVVMENKSYDQVRSAPYTASLIASGASFSNYYAITHPSQPNYLALWSGGTQGVSSDACPSPGSPYQTANLGSACEAAGLTWAAYSEELPSTASTACSASSGKYTRKHDPWTNWSNLNHQNERSYSVLGQDIAAGRLPNLAFVVPNNCNNTHDCSVATGDSWLKANLPAMIRAVGPRGVVVLTWDEDDHSQSNQILTVMVGPMVRRGYVSSQKANHYTLLRFVCDALGLSPFGAAARERSVSDVWAAS